MINGEFTLDLAGKERVLKCNFRAIEALETRELKKGMIKTLAEISNGDIYFTDVVKIIYVGLAASKDTRLSEQEIGEAVLSEGKFGEAVKVCVEFLTYAITGGKGVESQSPLQKANQE